MSEYIVYELIEEKPKTNVYAVKNKKSQNRIGFVKWHGAWRQYCFFPLENTVFSVGCMAAISGFIARLNKDQKQKKSEAGK